MTLNRLFFDVNNEQCLLTVTPKQEESLDDVYYKVYKLLEDKLKLNGNWKSAQIGRDVSGLIFYIPKELSLKKEVHEPINDFLRQRDSGND